MNSAASYSSGMKPAHTVCKKPVSCSVKTDVNPKAQQVSLAVGEKKSVVTWRGSPAYAFTPDVTCQ